ncbi:MAG: hypothetical protein U0354_13735 [Candidatus Sericytochromatia bacterium]
MSKTKNVSRVLIASLILASSLGMTGCKNRMVPGAITASSSPTVPDNFNSGAPQTEDLPSMQTMQPPAPINAAPNAQAGTFKVDQATFTSQWQAKGIAVSGGFIYVSAADNSGLFKKGSVLKMNSSDGKGWKDIGSTMLGARHPMDATVEGITINGSTIVAVDSAGKVYTLDASNGNPKVIKAAGGKDVASGGGSIYIANGSVEKTDTSATARTPVAGLNASGGVGSDNLGNLYAVSGIKIVKSDTTGQVMDIVTSDLSSPVDVAVDSRNGDLYVLDATSIKRFNSTGQIMSTFPSGATKPVAIATDESGAVYVADFGSSNKDSKVIKFAASADAQVSTSSTTSGGYNYGSSSSGSSDYSTYSNTRTSTTNPRKG